MLAFPTPSVSPYATCGALRQPAYVVITLAKPIIWLLLFSQLFTSVSRIPRFTGISSVDYLTPGGRADRPHVGGLDGMTFIDDMERG